MLLQNALFLFIPDIYIRGWTLASNLQRPTVNQGFDL